MNTQSSPQAFEEQPEPQAAPSSETVEAPEMELATPIQEPDAAVGFVLGYN